MSNSHNENVERTWDDFWKRKDQSSSQRTDSSKGFPGRLVHFFKRWEIDYNLGRWFKKTILKELHGSENKAILEAGCGKGETAVNIYSGQNKYFLLDKSAKALEISRSRFS